MSLRAWNPFYLRKMIGVFMRDIDRHDTETEQCWRFLFAVLRGDEHPADYALQYTVEGDTLVVHIDGPGGGKDV